MINEHNQIEEKLAASLTSETTELLPHLPYLLQDIWELGSNPRDMAQLIRENIDLSANTNILDLGCGKGAVSIFLSRNLGVHVKGVDLLPEFIEEAEDRSKENDIEHLCEFQLQDINLSVQEETGYDIVILGAVGNVLGDPRSTLEKLKRVTRTKGYILIDEAYLTGEQEEVQYQNYDYLTLEQWQCLFEEQNLKLVASCESEDSQDESINDENNEKILQRAMELSEKYPDKSHLFDGYVKSQEMECADLDDVVVGATWLLQKQH